VLNGVKNHMYEPSGSFVIADIFNKKDIDNIESKFRDYFAIEKKEVITINVKHAMNLDKPRIEKIIHSLSGSICMRKLLKAFFASTEGSKTYKDLGNTSDYVCYVLRSK
jgi:hypothetical protein